MKTRHSIQVAAFGRPTLTIPAGTLTLPARTLPNGPDGYPLRWVSLNRRDFTLAERRSWESGVLITRSEALHGVEHRTFLSAGGSTVEKTSA